MLSDDKHDSSLQPQQHQQHQQHQHQHQHQHHQHQQLHHRDSRISRFLRKRQIAAAAGGSHAMAQSMLLPSRPAFSSSAAPAAPASDPDDQADVSAPGKNMPFNMNQSLFHVISAATSSIRMGSRFDEETDDDDDGNDDGAAAHDAHAHAHPDSSRVATPGDDSNNKGKSKASGRIPGILPLRSGSVGGVGARGLGGGRQREGGGGARFNLASSGDDSCDDDDNDSDDHPSLLTQSSPKFGPAPFMSQILQAQAQINPADFGAPVQENEMHPSGRGEERFNKGEKSSELAKKLMDIFSLPKLEDVVSEYPCWLLKSVLLQGYLYITTHHICFYAYLPKKTDVASKSGYLSKRGRSIVKFTRYWFILKGDVLSYFSDSSDPYFPTGHIDLRYGISASLVDARDGKDPCDFTVTTNQRKYYFHADSAPSAKEWVKSLLKAIFRTQNESDSVKISIPVANVMAVEESPVLDFADTIKLNVIDNDDTYAIDEYFFSFFSVGNDALQVLQEIVEGSAASKIPEHLLDRSAVSVASSSLRENVRATLSPAGSAKGGSPRSSFELGRRSTDLSRENNSKGSPRRRSAEVAGKGRHRRVLSGDSSLPTDLSFGGESSDAIRMSSDDDVDDDDDNQSASHILSRSDVFRSPTMEKFGPRLSTKPRKGRGEKSPRDRDSSPGTTPIRAHPHSNHVMPQNESDSDRGGDGGSPRLQDIAKAGTFPLQRAAGWADWMKRRSKKMGTLLASQPMGYLEKVSDMWTGGRRHYREPMGMTSDEKIDDNEDDEEDADALVHGERFRAHFALPDTERLIAVYFGYLLRVLPLYGKIYLSNRNFCFRSMLPGTKTKLILPLRDIENVDKEKGFRLGHSGLVITIRGHEELFFEFSKLDLRDDCAIMLRQNIEDIRLLAGSGFLSREKQGAEAAKLEHQMLQDARREDPDGGHDVQLPTRCESSCVSEAPPIVFDDPCGSILNFKPSEPMNITCLTIGSRGDVQPYIALCKGLMRDGHRTKIATHAEFGSWIESHGIEFAPIEGDPAELMQLCVEYGMFTVEFIKVTTSKMRGWLDGLLESSWKACQGSDLLIESPSAMAGIHIAEALGIPYFRAFSMPWTRTRAYPHAFAVPEHKMGGAYNYFTYVVIDNVFWKSSSGQINRWRKKTLSLRDTNLDKLQINKVPFLYNFSPSVVMRPLDYSECIWVTGYWFLDQDSDWVPPDDLQAFIRKAREDGKKIVYVGFGSVTVADPDAMTRTVVESVLKADVRCILSKGWSDRLSKTTSDEPEVMPAEIFRISSCPHDWLFGQIDAACHHGGAGTTGASLRAGIPTIIKPFFGDQFFFGNRVEDLGVGVCIKKLNTSVFHKALWEATHNARMIAKAEVLGEQIRSENGVDTAIQAIYRDLDYARTLIKKRHMAGDKPEDSEESWTLVGADGSEAEHDGGSNKKILADISAAMKATSCGGK